MTSKPTLLDFCDDELLRAPLTFDLAVDAVIDRWRNTTSISRRHEYDAVRVLQRHRTELVGNAVRDLRGNVAAEVAGRQAAADPSQPPTSRRLELSLIEDDEVSADIEISRSVELIKSEAEAELRHLLSLTSALVNDLNVSRDTNPFRPDSFVRSLWQGVSGMPLSRTLQAAFMRDSAAPLAGILRHAGQVPHHRADLVDALSTGLAKSRQPQSDGTARQHADAAGRADPDPRHRATAGTDGTGCTNGPCGAGSTSGTATPQRSSAHRVGQTPVR
jgi:Protein of unknown function (DUF1631)